MAQHLQDAYYAQYLAENGLSSAATFANPYANQVANGQLQQQHPLLMYPYLGNSYALYPQVEQDYNSDEENALVQIITNPYSEASDLGDRTREIHRQRELEQAGVMDDDTVTTSNLFPDLTGDDIINENIL